MSVNVVVADGVGSVTIDNPPVNALDDETLEGLLRAARELEDREDVRAVVLSGAGDRAFAAGADLRTLSAGLGPDGAPAPPAGRGRRLRKRNRRRVGTGTRL
jgi:enoyl-CoA hydratase/carnithine racemase